MAEIVVLRTFCGVMVNPRGPGQLLSLRSVFVIPQSHTICFVTFRTFSSTSLCPMTVADRDLRLFSTTFVGFRFVP